MGQGEVQHGSDYDIIHEPPPEGGGGDVPLCRLCLPGFTVPYKGEGRLREHLGGRAGQVERGDQEGVGEEGACPWVCNKEVINTEY